MVDASLEAKAVCDRVMNPIGFFTVFDSVELYLSTPVADRIWLSIKIVDRLRYMIAVEARDPSTRSILSQDWPEDAVLRETDLAGLGVTSHTTSSTEGLRKILEAQKLLVQKAGILAWRASLATVKRVDEEATLCSTNLVVMTIDVERWDQQQCVAWAFELTIG